LHKGCSRTDYLKSIRTAASGSDTWTVEQLQRAITQLVSERPVGAREIMSVRHGGGESRKSRPLSEASGHFVAMQLLKRADTLLERKKSVAIALSLGMPLHRIEEFLDGLDGGKAPSYGEFAQ